MFHVEPDHIEAQLACHFGQPRLGNAVNTNNLYKSASAQLASQPALYHVVLNSVRSQRNAA
jgi:hypothetical protein